MLYSNYGRDDGHRIYCCDAFAFLKQEAADTRKLRSSGNEVGYRTIVTSPRYNTGKAYGRINDRTSRGVYLEEMEKAGELLYEVAADDCVFFLNVGDDSEWPDRSWQVMNAYRFAGWDLVQTLVWTKHQSGRGHFTPILGTKHVTSVTENIFIMVKDLRFYTLDRLAVGVEYTDKSNIDRFNVGQDLRCRGNLWFIPYETTGRSHKKGRPATFPVNLPKMCIKLNGCKYPVLDPFAGSLTTAVACEELELPYTVLESSEQAVEFGIQRILKVSKYGD